MAGAGDVNGDGFDDVIVGAPLFDTDMVDAGRALVYLGSATGLSSVPDWVADGDQAYARFGHAVSARLRDGPTVLLVQAEDPEDKIVVEKEIEEMRASGELQRVIASMRRSEGALIDSRHHSERRARTCNTTPRLPERLLRPLE